MKKYFQKTFCKLFKPTHMKYGDRFGDQNRTFLDEKIRTAQISK